MSPTEPTIASFNEVCNSLYELTEGLSEAQWLLPSPCPGWSVADQLAHLIAFERLLLGEPSPEVDISNAEHVHNEIGELNERWVESFRATPGNVLRENFREAAEARLLALRAMSPEDFELVGWSPIGQVPYRLFMETRVLDCWIHEQDIRVALGRPGGRAGAGERTTVDRLLAGIGRSLAKKVDHSEGKVVSLVLTGAIPRVKTIAVIEGRGSDRDDLSVDATVTMDSWSFSRAATGRISPEEALSSEGFALSGDQGLGEGLVRALNSMI